jgi:hypothetical protein
MGVVVPLTTSSHKSGRVFRQDTIFCNDKKKKILAVEGVMMAQLQIEGHTDIKRKGEEFISYDFIGENSVKYMPKLCVITTIANKLTPPSPILLIQYKHPPNYNQPINHFIISHHFIIPLILSSFALSLIIIPMPMS